jgi:hypothetical protein
LRKEIPKLGKASHGIPKWKYPPSF